MTDKKALRKDVAARRALAHESVDPSPALAKLKSALEGCEAPLSFYWPIRTEIDPRAVMEAFAARTDVCLPVTVGYAPLIFRRWTPGATMDVDGFGVAVPAEGPEVTPRTLVVPMLAFDDAGHRLGYGAGHYDRTLARLRPEAPVTGIGFAYEAQRVDELPTEATDQPLDIIITEAGIRRFTR
ncbi:MAG: 5-formyltetrahydrofolate cyclo-ligase [Pseudomonadota bacterium]